MTDPDTPPTVTVFEQNPEQQARDRDQLFAQMPERSANAWRRFQSAGLDVREQVRVLAHAAASPQAKRSLDTHAVALYLRADMPDANACSYLADAFDKLDAPASQADGEGGDA